MSKWGKFDFSEFEQLAKTFKKALDERVIERFIQDFLLEMAYRAERKIKKRTPVDTGELRRNWKVGRVERRGNAYQVDIFNPTEYAIYVEYGHRAGNDLTKWVEGRFMMTISMQEIERELPRYLEKRVMQLLNDIMNGRPPRKE
ncbi:HK97 gp10 family phage protein [Thermicanus aegyptius]|uniref:HK97 gp10 family phage protein n=1 Tax=Thermicanus aegyptius TaxID=94009 RepID=UPI00040CDD48|nr:HK97 gp10 family phage protein [Thermicanus aegyptius]